MKTTVKEEWKDIKGYENLYQVSTLGNIRSIKNGKIKMRKLTDDMHGYYKVTLSKNDKKKTFKVHRLVAETFIDNPKTYNCVNHKDENKKNNKVSNLEWCTKKYNTNYGTAQQRHSETRKRLFKEGKLKTYKPTKKVKCLNTNTIFPSIKEATNWAGLKSTDCISKQIKGKRSHAGKHPITKEPLKWEYPSEN